MAPQVEEPKLKEVPPPDKDVKELIIKKEKPKKKVAEPKKPQVIHDRPGHITIKYLHNADTCLNQSQSKTNQRQLYL